MTKQDITFLKIEIYFKLETTQHCLCPNGEIKNGLGGAVASRWPSTYFLNICNAPLGFSFITITL